MVINEFADIVGLLHITLRTGASGFDVTHTEVMEFGGYMICIPCHAD